MTPADAIRVLESDFKNVDDNKTLSQDIIFLNKLSDGVRKNSFGHFEMPLPFTERPCLPDNRQLALVRHNHLKRKLLKDQGYKEHYVEFMDDVIKRGEAEEVKDVGSEGNGWYVPHHSVYHPKKSSKLRVVLDCSARYDGIRLNDHLLQRPELLNCLTGVLRFHCVNYRLKHLAEGNEEQYPLGSQFVMNDFYVDDCVTSVQTTEDAIQLAQEASEICAIGVLRLHKYLSNDKAVLESILPSERVINVKEPDLSFNDSLTERTLGIQWNMELDCFKFDICLREQTASQCGILSTIALLYDPCLDIDGGFKVGGRLSNSSLCSQLKHPASIPKDHHITKLIIADCHKRVKHQGKEYLSNIAVRQGLHTPKKSFNRDMVIVKDNDLPGHKWSFSRTVETTLGLDRLVRRVGSSR